MRKLPGAYAATRSRRREFAIRNLGLETPAPDVGAFCCAKIRLGVVQKQTSLLECTVGKNSQRKGRTRCRSYRGQGLSDGSCEPQQHFCRPPEGGRCG